MEDKISIEKLLKTVLEGLKPSFDGIEAFEELCSFASDVGYKKIGETDKEIVLKDDSDNHIMKIPKPYKNYKSSC